MANGDDAICKWARNLLYFILIVLSAAAAIDARISAQVGAERIDRKEGDVRVEKRLDRIEAKIDRLIERGE